MNSLDRLRTLAVVVAAPSFRAAAEQLGLSVSAVSQQMRALEDELGVPLFERVGRRSVPTEATRALVADVRASLQQVDRAIDRARATHHEVRGTLRVGGPRVFLGWWLRGRVPPLLARHPALTLTIDFERPALLERRLAEGTLDLAFLVGAPELASLESELAVTVRSVLVGAPSYLDAAGRALGARALRRHRYITHAADAPLLGPLWRAAFGARSELPDRRACTVPGIDLMRVLAEEGVGLAVIPRYLADPSIAAGRLERLEPRPASRRDRGGLGVYLAWRRGRVSSAAFEALRDALGS